jgi:hypothetical protein
VLSLEISRWDIRHEDLVGRIKVQVLLRGAKWRMRLQETQVSSPRFFRIKGLVPKELQPGRESRLILGSSFPHSSVYVLTFIDPVAEGPSEQLADVGAIVMLVGGVQLLEAQVDVRG